MAEDECSRWNPLVHNRGGNSDVLKLDRNITQHTDTELWVDLKDASPLLM